MALLPLGYHARSLWARSTTTLATVAGVAAVVAVFAAALMLGAGVDASLASTGLADNAILLRRGATSDYQSVLGREPARAALADEGIAADERGPLASPELVVVVVMPTASGGRVNVNVRGVGPRALEVHRQARVADGRMLRPAAGEVVIGRTLAGRLAGVPDGQAALGATLRLGRQSFRVVGLLEAGGAGYESEVWGDVDALLDAFQRAAYSMVAARIRPGAFPSLKARLEADPRLSIDVRREDEHYGAQSRNLGLYVRILGLFMAAVFALGATIGAMMTMYGQVAARRREIATLRALGFSRLSVLVGFVLEALTLSLVGGAAGLVLASGLERARFPILNLQTVSVVVLRFRLTPTVALSTLGFAAAIGVVGGLLPAVRAARLRVVEAMRAE